MSFKAAQDKMRASLAAMPMVMAAVLVVGLHATDAKAADEADTASVKESVGQAAKDYELLRQRMYQGRVAAIFSSPAPGATYGETSKTASANVPRVIPGVIDYTRPYRPGTR